MAAPPTQVVIAGCGWPVVAAGRRYHGSSAPDCAYGFFMFPIVAIVHCAIVLLFQLSTTARSARSRRARVTLSETGMTMI